MSYKTDRIEFPEDVVKEAWKSAGNRCECTRKYHNHYLNRCTQVLEWSKRGVEGPGGWEAHHIDRTGPGTLSNCQILCIPCHKDTQSYGKY